METIASLINLKNLLLAAMIFIPIENLLPMHEGQKMLRRAWLNDLVYALLDGIVVGLKPPTRSRRTPDARPRTGAIPMRCLKATIWPPEAFREHLSRRRGLV